MERILTKTIRVSKRKKSGVIKVQDKTLLKYVGKKVVVKVSI
ncbi:hypothetical protein LCGC14_2491380 [marine sediment metagenome]|uniref:Uncharacterized protein n=1 Tax=marine sediment metagenome TaxID=412755 RepID=A0A0F9BSJ0_9ZZZZ